MDDHEPEGPATALWRRAVEALLAKGAPPAEAIDGANLILTAYERQRDQDRGPESGKRRTG
jgi:hypothetical protein